MKMLTNLAKALAMLCFAFGTLSAQNEAAPAGDDAPAAELGTFQIIHTGKGELAINTEVLKLIEANRDEENTVYLDLGLYSKAKIISRRELNDPEFVPFTNLFVVE